MRTRVSVIIPIYNVEEFLNDCLDSIVAQTINSMDLTDGYQRNLQVILIDSGSTDTSERIAKKYVEKHDNFEYYSIENKGPGYARNYGVRFAEGDYIIFLDADDIVRPYAYERMYKLALKNNSDMTIGAVWFFDYRSCWRSPIHEMAFSGTKECTHITESPELFYDARIWNKLIKRSFWEENNFRIPEGMVYEDIPISMAMHYFSNNVSMIYENCFLWRVRGGLSKSITQSMDGLENLANRLRALGMVDDFFKKHVSDEKLVLTKNVKWLNHDLMRYIDDMRNMTKEEAENYINILCDYIEKNIDPKYLKHLNEINTLKYGYLMEKDYEKLFNLINFEYYKLHEEKLYLQDSRITVDCDEDLIGVNSLTIDKYIKEGMTKRYLQRVDYKKEAIEIVGYVIIPGLKDDSFSDREYSFYLVNANNHKRIPLEHEDIEINKMENFKFKDSFSYKSAGYKVFIPYTILNENPDFYGENRVLVTFKQEDITHNFFASYAPWSVKGPTNLKAIFKENTYFIIKYDLNNEFVIDIHRLEHIYEKVTSEDGKLCIYSDENFGNVNIYYEKDSLNDEKKIPLDYDTEKKCYSVDIEKILPYKGRILYENGLPLVHKEKKLIFSPSNKGQCILNTLKDYNYDIYMSKNISVIEDKIHRQEQTINFKTRLYSSEDIEGKYAKVRLLLKDEKTHKNQYILDGKYFKESNESEFTIELFDDDIMKCLYQGIRDFYIEYDFGDIVFSTLIYPLIQFDYSYGTRFNAYHLYRGFDSTLRIRTTKRNLIFENEHYKKYNLTPKLYKLFRFLPIKKNRVMFESMWGSKYSCNPRYLYEYIDGNHSDFECVWSLEDEHIPINGKGIKVRRNGLKYFYYLATSKYFVDNVNYGDNFIKRNGQVYIQTMHGTPLKTLGLDVPTDFPTLESQNKFIERCKRWDYISVQSDFVADISKRCHAYKKDFLKYGYPRTDILYTKNNPKDIAGIKKKLGLPTDKKVILYAPTWRVRNRFDLKLDIDSFRKSLSDEYILILKLHHYSAKGWKQPKQDDFIYDLTSYDSIEELYLIADVLITDYSSVMFDYAILDRPILLFTYDLNVYRDKLRGLYVDIEENRPGPMLFTSDEVENAIVNLDQTEKESASLRKKFQEKFLQYECENSSEKIFNDVMNKKKRK